MERLRLSRRDRCRWAFCAAALGGLAFACATGDDERTATPGSSTSPTDVATPPVSSPSETGAATSSIPSPAAIPNASLSAPTPQPSSADPNASTGGPAPTSRPNATSSGEGGAHSGPQLEAGTGGAEVMAGDSGSAMPGTGNLGGTAGESTADAGMGLAGASGAPLGPLTIYIAGDSTVSTYADTASPNDQAGWGQMLHERFDERVTVENRAIGGRTARRFIDEGRLAEIDALLSPGDYFLVQFGTNDGNTTASYDLNGQTIPYYLDPDTDFKAYLGQYIEVAANRDSTLVFVTPPPRNSAYCTGGNGTGTHARAMRELGAEAGIAVADLNAKTVAHLQAICPAPTPEDFFLVRTDGSVDGTHFQENGARFMAGFVAEGVAEALLPLATLLR